MYQLDENGLPESRLAQHVIGAPSTYGRGRNTAAITTRTRGARLNGFAYDSVHKRIFARDYTEFAWQPHGRVLVFNADPETMETGEEAIAVIGQPDFTSYRLGGVGRQKMGSIDQEALDEKNQRLFLTDRMNNRVMVWDIHPDRLTATPEAMAVLGQDDFTSKQAGSGPAGFDEPGDLYYDEETDRLFVADMGNNRVLVFEAAPGQLETGMTASEVLGQPDFESNEPGTAADRFSKPSQLAYDQVFDRLFIIDGGPADGPEVNQVSDELLGKAADPESYAGEDGPTVNRILVFNATPDALRTGAKADHVIGQPDFTTREHRTDVKKWAEGLVLDENSQRLFANEGDRMLVFDIHPDRLKNNPDASNLVFANSWDEGFGPNAPASGLGIVSRTQSTAVKVPLLDDENEILYAAASYMGRNAVSIWDVSKEHLKEVGTPAIDVLGQYDWAGNVDFSERAANGRASERWIYPRGTALDPVNHRLFVNDQYMHRVVVFDLDNENRPLDQKADIILGQPNAYTGERRPISARDMNIPLALAYDPVGEHLFVADGGNNRIMVFDADPGALKNYDEATAIIGQQDFTSRKKELNAKGVNFGVVMGRGITSTSPLPMGFAVDTKRRRLFVSDGINHRILVYNIGAEKVETGMAAAAVIGQPDFESNEPRTGAGGVNTPSGLDYDPDHDRLFVADGINSRVLVFNAAPEDIGPDQEAIAVLGQDDFTSREAVRLDRVDVSEDVGRQRMRMPSGVAYDRRRQELYVNDKGNDRILVFDAAPDALQSGMAAKSVIGQPNFTTRIAGDGEQEQLLDPRQLAFDAENRRLYVTDSFWGRLMMFDLPRAERTVVVQSHGTKKYETLDAWNGRPQPEDPRWGMPKDDARQAWRSVLEGDGGIPGATLVYHNTRRELDPKSLRRSRVLISETSLTVPPPRPSALYFVAEGEDTGSRVVVSNPNSTATRVTFRLKIADGDSGWLSSLLRSASARENLEVTRTLEPGAQFEAGLSELFERDVEGMGTLQVAAADGAAVTSFVLQHRRTSRDEDLLLAAPGGDVPAAGTPVALSGLKWGGGFRSELVLLNPHEEAISGEVSFFDNDGEPVEVRDGTNRIAYEIAPGGAFRWTKESAATWPQEVYAVLEGEGALPSGGAVVSLWRGPLLVTQLQIPVRSRTHHAWVPVDTEPSIIRHGRSRMAFTIANPSRWPATLRFTLFDNNGAEKGRYEQVLPPHMQQQWYLADLFNMQAFEGSVRLWSDVEVAVNAKRTTETLRHEPVEDHISYLTAEEIQDQRRLELPGVIDGEGIATQVIFTNPGPVATEADWKFLSPAGEPREIVLR